MSPVFNDLSKSRLNELFTYDSGRLLWAVDRGNKQLIGKECGSVNTSGYRQVRVDGRLTVVHRVIWVMFNGDIPDGFTVDHINRDKTDNRIENLRLADRSLQSFNISLKCNNASGVTGVSWNERDNVWKVNRGAGKGRYLGSFKDFFEAVCARKSAEVFANG